MFPEVLGPSTTGIYNVHNVITGSYIILSYFVWQDGLPIHIAQEKGCTVIAKNNFQIQALDIVYA